MRRVLLPALVGLALLEILAPTALAGTVGVVSTDRFGYTGTVERYATLADAQASTNQIAPDIAIGERDLSLYIVNQVPAFDTDYNIIMGSWWYSIGGSGAGWGNINGNSGRGFVQLYDVDSSTDTSQSFEFRSFNGTYWTEFSAKVSGVNAGSADSARFWVDYQGPGADTVIYHEYSLEFVAGGLEGTATSGLIESFNQPTSVTGTYSGIFENVSTSYPGNNGFYRFSLDLSMTNWAWANRADLVEPYPSFADSYFAAAVPVPAAAWMGLTLLGGLAAGARMRRRRCRLD